MAYTKNILTIYYMATPEEIYQGKNWYLNAQKQAQAIALDFDIPLSIVVGVIAALSPNNKWERNVVNARDMIKAYTNGDSIESFKVSTYHTMKAKAWTILDLGPDANHDAILKVLNGQKICSFFLDIMGRYNCTIDGHAYNIARGERVGLTSDKTNIGKALYRELQDAYFQAADAMDIKPYEMQAITWTVWKRVHNI
jgi:hypothetical protein